MLTATKKTTKTTATATAKKTATATTKTTATATKTAAANIFNNIEKFNFSDIIKNDTVRDALTEREKKQVIVYNYIKELLKDDNTLTCILQCNYKYAKNKDSHAFDLIRICYTDNLKQQLTNIYISSIKDDNITLKIYCTAKKEYTEKCSELQYDSKKHYKTILYNDLLKEIKALQKIYKK